MALECLHSGLCWGCLRPIVVTGRSQTLGMVMYYCNTSFNKYLNVDPKIRARRVWPTDMLARCTCCHLSNSILQGWRSSRWITRSSSSTCGVVDMVNLHNSRSWQLSDAASVLAIHTSYDRPFFQLSTWMITSRSRANPPFPKAFVGIAWVEKCLSHLEKCDSSFFSRQVAYIPYCLQDLWHFTHMSCTTPTQCYISSL